MAFALTILLGFAATGAANNPKQNVKSHSSKVIIVIHKSVSQSPRVSYHPVETTTTIAPVVQSVASTTTTTVPVEVPTTAQQTQAVQTTASGVPGYVVSAFECIAQIESNNEPWVINPSSGDSGLYQFAIGTWLAYGGGQYAPQAYLATASEQTAVAYTAWQQAGFSPWNGDNRCW